MTDNKEQAVGVRESVTLDVAQIRQLVEFAQAMDPETDPETLIAIAWLDNIVDDDGNVSSGHAAYLVDYPEEGCYPLTDADDPRTAKWEASRASHTTGARHG